MPEDSALGAESGWWDGDKRDKQAGQTQEDVSAWGLFMVVVRGWGLGQQGEVATCMYRNAAILAGNVCV